MITFSWYPNKESYVTYLKCQSDRGLFNFTVLNIHKKGLSPQFTYVADIPDLQRTRLMPIGDNYDP